MGRCLLPVARCPLHGARCTAPPCRSGLSRTMGQNIASAIGSYRDHERDQGDCISMDGARRVGSRPTFLLLQDGRPRTGSQCPRPRSAAAGQPVSRHLRGAPPNSTSRRRRYARTTAASQITKWLCPAAQPPPRKHHATGAATRGGSGCHSGRRYAWPVLQRFASSQPTHRRLLPLIPCLHSAVARAGRCAAGHICFVI